MGYEDFTTFTEVDVDFDRIQKTANHIDHSAKSDETTYLYKDYGIGHFGDFTHKIRTKLVSGHNDDATCGYVWVLANDIAGCYWLRYNNKTFIGLYICYTAGTQLQFVLNETHGDNGYWDWNTGGFDLGDWIYVKIVKTGTSLNAYLYSDSSYSILVDTLTLTLHADHTFRYLEGCNTWNSGSGFGIITAIENFNIAEYIPYPHQSGRDGGMGAHLQGGIGK